LRTGGRRRVWIRRNSSLGQRILEDLRKSDAPNTRLITNERSNMIAIIFSRRHSMSRTPNSRKDETHERIVDVAARAIRKHGYAGLGVAEVMRQAGLTHGGFYAHFASRDALLVEALERAQRDSAAVVARAAAARRGRNVGAFRSLVETYLNDAYLASLEVGCPVAALGSDMPRQSQAVREASVARVEALIAAVRSTLPRTSRSTAVAVAGTLVGSLQIARTLGNNANGRAVLAAARKSLLRQYDVPPPVAT
jgi:AcrR family transcriptional regulator